MLFRSFLVLFVLVGCSRAGVSTTRLPDGTREVRCEYALWKCVQHVEDYCKGASFEVVRGTDEQIVYGAPSPNSIEGRRSYVLIRCLKPGESPKKPGALASAAPEPPPPAATSVSRPPVPAPVTQRCVPGTTQSCVGAGACAGGQACLADGTGFGPCDCGVSAKPPPG